jgi:hypothetical protein
MQSMSRGRHKATSFVNKPGGRKAWEGTDSLDCSYTLEESNEDANL